MTLLLENAFTADLVPGDRDVVSTVTESVSIDSPNGRAASLLRSLKC